MSNRYVPTGGYGDPEIYEIRLRGQLSHRWSDWFAGLTITHDEADTLLTGPITDQAALHGLLRTIRDLGMPLISVRSIQPEPGDRRIQK